MSSGKHASAADLRREYVAQTLTEADLQPDPLKLFQQWFDEAVAFPILEPNAMTLSTASQAGEVSSRTVLLKAFDDRGFVFFTNYDSPKAQDLAENPQAALLFPWLALERQVAIRGLTEKVSRDESLAYFLTRPLGNRIGAWVSHQSQVIASRTVLETKLKELSEKFKNGDVPLPDFWGGYRLIPQTIEFWQGRPCRLHDRFQYSRHQSGWQVRRLSP